MPGTANQVQPQGEEGHFGALRERGWWGMVEGMNAKWLMAVLLGGAVSGVAAGEALAPKAVCPEPDFDFGELENTETVEHDYVIRNEGQLSLEILSVKPSCGCTAASPSQKLIAPGQEGTVHASFGLQNRSGYQDKSITVTCNDPGRPTFVLRLHGTAVQSVRATPSSVFFGRVGAGSVRSRTFEVSSSKGRFAVEEARTDSEWLRLEEGEENPDPAVKTYRVTLAEGIPAGDVRGNVIIRVIQSDGVPKTVTVPVQAFIAPEVAPADGEP